MTAPCTPARRRQLFAALLLALAAAVPGPAMAATGRAPTLAPTNTVVDGPSADITGLDGLSVARDGTGGLVYVKNVNGVAHVFVSGLRNGAFQPPVQVDGGLAGPSSQPVIAATNTGLTLVAFINSGQLYAAEQPNALTPWQAPVALYGYGASNPALSMSTYGKAYLAFTALGGGGHDVRVVAFNKGQWTPGTGVLDANPADDAGAGTARPQVTTAGDGTAIVVWGENGHVYTRRVRGADPSVAFQQADPPVFAGWSEVSADEPAIGSGGDSSFAAVAFHEVLTSGGVRQSRVLVAHLRASVYDSVTPGDALTTPGGEGATNPRVAVSEFGPGWVTSQGDQSDNAYVANLGTNEVVTSQSQLNSLSESGAPDAVPALAGITSSFVAWQQYGGASGLPEIRVRYAPDGVHLDPDVVVSSPLLGPTNADLGLFGAGDVAGDAAIAWVQGSGGQARIVTAQLFQGLKGFSTSQRFFYSRSVNPLFAWVPPSELWGPLSFTVKVDGAVVGGVAGGALISPVPLTQGRHTWQVTAVNLAGLTSGTPAATVFVDSLAPQARLTLSGRRFTGARVRAGLRATDVSPGLPAAAASGIATSQIRWGDGARATIGHSASHVYRRRGTYTITVLVTDRAGNRTVVTKRVRITAPPKAARKTPGPRKKRKKKG